MSWLQSCFYCNKTGATIGCVNKKCRRSYHMCCGLQNSAQFSFCGEFRTWCRTHRSYQKIPEVKADCPICMEEVDANDKDNVIWAPCCRRSDLFHKFCIQKLALSAGYFFKCPLCNDKNAFIKAVQNNGVYVPEQDASWELEPNAYQELLERPLDCVAPICLCPAGRSDNKRESSWELTFCQLCGSQAIHTRCQVLVTCSSRTEWHCVECTSLLADSARRERTLAKTRQRAQQDASSSQSQTQGQNASQEPHIDAGVRLKEESRDGSPVNGDGDVNKPSPHCSFEQDLIQPNSTESSSTAAGFREQLLCNEQNKISNSKSSPDEKDTGTTFPNSQAIAPNSDVDLPSLAFSDVQSQSAVSSGITHSFAPVTNDAENKVLQTENYPSSNKEFSPDHIDSLSLGETVSRTSTPKRKASDHSEESTQTPKRWTPSFKDDGQPEQKESKINISGCSQGEKVSTDDIFSSRESQPLSPRYSEDESKINGVSPTLGEHKQSKASNSKSRDHANDSKTRRRYHRRKDLHKTTQVSITNFFTPNK